jgi:DNA polymerase-3 subunit delta'
MAFTEFSARSQGVQLLQRSLARRRLGHAYLFTGHDLDQLETLAKTLAKTLNCTDPVRTDGTATDCCDRCANCRKIDHENHADVTWARPESKSRLVTIDQVRDLMHAVQMKPTESPWKVAIIAGADRLNTQAANAFLKTLEEPPAQSILILLSTEPGRILETILSRCLRLNFAVEGRPVLDAAQSEWLNRFSNLAATGHKSLLGRYLLLDVLLQRLTQLREETETVVSARSPLEKYPDVEKDLRERWEDELKAAIEAEYRRRRGDLLNLLQGWLRDVWLHTLRTDSALLTYPEIYGTEDVAARLTPHQAGENLARFEQTRRLLFTNVQEALALEVGLLKLNL